MLVLEVLLWPPVLVLLYPPLLVLDVLVPQPPLLLLEPLLWPASAGVAEASAMVAIAKPVIVFMVPIH